MKIDGRQIASEIKDGLKKQSASLPVIPHLAVILVGNDPSSLTYIRQKQKAAEELGVRITNYELRNTNRKEAIITLVNKLNKDRKVTGIIIQRPVPIEISKEELDRLVIPSKDVDGFHPQTLFTPPVASAVLKILQWVEKDCCSNPDSPLKQNYCEPFLPWLKKQKILVIGRGETAGKPVADTLKKMEIPFVVAHSQTNNLKELCQLVNIIISCVGKPNVVRHTEISDKSIVIGVGLHEENGRLATDYNQEEIAQKAAYWTPVPGGVGPVNVACLFENLVSRRNSPIS